MAVAGVPRAAEPQGAPNPLASPSPLEPTFVADDWADIPQGQWPWSLFETVEGSTVTDRIGNGGLYTGEPTLLGVHGSSWRQVSYHLADLDITDPDRTGTPMFLPDAMAFEKVSAATALMPADDPGPGAAVRFAPRKGGDAWHGALAGAFVPAGLQSSVPSGPPAVSRYAAFGTGRVRAGGPLAGERLRLFVSAAVTRARRLEGNDPTEVPANDANGLANLSWSASPSDEIALLAAAQTVTHDYSGSARLGVDGAREKDRFVVVQSSWRRGGLLPVFVSAGFVHGAFEPDTNGGSVGVVDRLRDGPVPQLFAGSSRRQRTSLAARLGPLEKTGLGGRHALRFGLEGAWTRSATRAAGAAGLTPEAVGGTAARVWDYGWPGGEAVWRAADFSAYAADAARYGRASLDLGARFESRGASGDQSPARVRWTTISPRVAAHVGLTRGGGAVLLAGYARYYERPSLGLAAYGDPNAPQGSVYQWLDANGDGVFEAGERGSVIARVGPGGTVASVDPALKAPATDEVVAGLEVRLGGSWRAHVLGIHRRERSLLAVVNEGAPLSAYRVFSVPDPGGDLVGSADDQLLPVYDRVPATFGEDRYRLVNTAATVLHEGVEVGASGTLGNRLKLSVGAMTLRSVGRAGDLGFLAQENDPGILDDGIGSPNVATFARGRLFFDRAYTLKVAAAYRAPGDLRVGAEVRYQDGQPFARLVIAPDLEQGAEAVRAISNGYSRFTYTLTVDARVEKGFSAGRTRIAGVFEVFNALGDAREVEETVVTGASFRAVSAVQPPRAFRLGARLEF